MTTHTFISRLFAAASGLALAAVLTLGGCPATTTGPAAKNTTPTAKPAPAAPVKNKTTTIKGAEGAATAGGTQKPAKGANPDNPDTRKANGTVPDAKKHPIKEPAPIKKVMAPGAKAPATH